MQPIDTNNVQSLVPYQSNESTSLPPFENLLADIRDNHIFSLLRIKDLLFLGKTNKSFHKIIALFDISKSLNFFSVEPINKLSIETLFKIYVAPNYLNLLLDHLFSSEKDEQFLTKTMEGFLLSVNQLENSQIDELIEAIICFDKEFEFDLGPKLNQGFVKILESRAFQGSEIAIDTLLTCYQYEDFGLKKPLSDILSLAKDFADNGSEKAIAFLIEEGIESTSDGNTIEKTTALITEYAKENSEKAIDFIKRNLIDPTQENPFEFIKNKDNQGDENYIKFLVERFFKEDLEQALSSAKTYAEQGSEAAITFLLKNNQRNLDKEAFLECVKRYADKGSEVAIYAYLSKNSHLEIDQLLALITAYADLGSEKALDFLIDLFRDQDYRKEYSKENQNKILDFIKLYADKNVEAAVRFLLNPHTYIIDKEKRLEHQNPKKRLALRKQYAKQGSLQALSAFILN